MNPTSHAMTAGRAAATRPALPRLSHYLLEYLLSLPAGVLVAIAWANTFPESYFRASYAAAFVVNDVAMVLFFALMGKEIVESTAAGGVLHPARRAALPLIGALVAALVTLLMFDAATAMFDEPMLSRGWPAALATDLAVSYVVARIVFGRHPAVPFLLLLAMASDALGFIAVAFVQPAEGTHRAVSGVLMLLALAVAALLRARRVRSIWPYVLCAGGVSWAALFLAGAGPAFALLPILPFMQHGTHDPGFLVDTAPGARDTLSRLERTFKYPALVGLFFFGLVNGGVVIRALEPGAWSLPLAVLIGKPIGVLVGVALAVSLGLHLPARTGWREIVVVGVLLSVGFTVALFFAASVLPPGQLLAETKMGALLTIAGAVVAPILARVLRVGRFGPAHHEG